MAVLTVMDRTSKARQTGVLVVRVEQILPGSAGNRAIFRDICNLKAGYHEWRKVTDNAR